MTTASAQSKKCIGNISGTTLSDKSTNSISNFISDELFCAKEIIKDNIADYYCTEKHFGNTLPGDCVNSSNTSKIADPYSKNSRTKDNIKFLVSKELDRAQKNIDSFVTNELSINLSQLVLPPMCGGENVKLDPQGGVSSGDVSRSSCNNSTLNKSKEIFEETPVPLFNYVLEHIIPAQRSKLDRAWMDQVSHDLVRLLGDLNTKQIIPDFSKWLKVMEQEVKENPLASAFTHMLLRKSTATIAVWTIPKNCQVPMHSHPARAIGKLLCGSIQSKNEKCEITNYNSGDIFKVDEENNLHELTGIATISTFIEVVFPSYRNSSECAYFEYDPITLQYLETSYPPLHFNTLRSPYFGTQIELISESEESDDD